MKPYTASEFQKNSCSLTIKNEFISSLYDIKSDVYTMIDHNGCKKLYALNYYQT